MAVSIWASTTSRKKGGERGASYVTGMGPRESIDRLGKREETPWKGCLRCAAGFGR